MPQGIKEKTRLYLIRHGETQWNKEGKYQGCTNIPLSDLGEWQAALLAKRFKYIDLDAIYTSPLDRAKNTALPIAKEKGLELIEDEYFKEINFGEWEGCTVEELKLRYGEKYSAFWENPFCSEMPGEGSFKEVGKRALKGIKRVLEKHKGQRVAIVSHGGFLRILLIELMDLDLNFYRKTWLTNTSVTMVDVGLDGDCLLMTLNDKAHLEMSELFNE